MPNKKTDPPAEPDRADDEPFGRPLLVESVEALDLAIQNYFAECDPHTAKALVETGRDSKGNMLFDTRTVLTDQKPYTMYGLARALKCDRKTLHNYKKRDEFFPSIQYALDRCAEYAESQLFGPYANGAKFSLNVNYGLVEKKQTALTGLDDEPLTIKAVEVMPLADADKSKAK